MTTTAATFAARFWDQFKDLLFPIWCLRCGREGRWVCEECLAVCPPPPLQRCVFCRGLSPFGETCRGCRRRHVLSGVTVRGIYQEWVWRPLLHAWKYQGAYELWSVAAALVAACPVPRPPVGEPQLVLPVPLARRRERERGFNQSQVLAEALGRSLGVPVSLAVLVRTRETKAQAKLSHEERQINVREAFRCTAPLAVRGRSCILVDDIVTTGATLESAARALRDAGAGAVWGAALVRSDFSTAQQTGTLVR